MRPYIVTLMGSLLSIGAAHAASGVTTKFDGNYIGKADPAPPSSATSLNANALRPNPQCQPFALDNIKITNGSVASVQQTDPASVQGFITELGYLEATIKLPNGHRTALNGRLENGTLVAGAIDETSGCSWIVKLQP